MIIFLKTWVNQIIISVIIATICEMIIPDGNNKKYIKIVIGLYVLITIIQPVITKITGENINISNFNYQKYFDKESAQVYSQDFEDNNSKLIKQAYIDNIKEDIKVKIGLKGYEVISCNINILEDTDTYGKIENITLKIRRKENNKVTNENIVNVIEIEEVKIENNTQSNYTKETSNISNKENNEIIKYISNEYGIDIEKILIN